MPLTDAQHMGQQKAIVKCLIAIHQERSPPLPPVLPWLALNGRVVKDPVYETAHAEHGSWGAAIAASLIAAVNQYRATQTGRATVAIKAPSALVEPLDALALAPSLWLPLSGCLSGPRALSLLLAVSVGACPSVECNALQEGTW